MKQFAIVTASDRRYGDFLIEQWLRSLTANIRLDAIEVVVLDYGLSLAQRFYLEQRHVRLWPGRRDGHVTTLRYRELRDLLIERPYQQVCLCDSGDIVFQDDIAPLFEQAPATYRAVCEDYKPAFSFFIKDDVFSPADKQAIADTFIKHRMINGGLIIGPRDKMIELCDACLAMIVDQGQFGPDQLVVNHVLHRAGFTELERRYNFVITTCAETVRIEDGFFLDQEGRRIAVVHNAGNTRFLRPIDNFGYGPGHNLLRKELYTALRGFYASRVGLATARDSIQRSRRELADLIRRLRTAD